MNEGAFVDSVKTKLGDFCGMDRLPLDSKCACIVKRRMETMGIIYERISDR